MDWSRILKVAGGVAVALFVAIGLFLNFRSDHAGSSAFPSVEPSGTGPAITPSASPTKHSSGGTTPTEAKALATLCSASLRASPLIHSVQVRADAGHFGSLGEDAALLNGYAAQVQSAATLFQEAGDSKIAAAAHTLSAGMATISRGATGKSTTEVNQGAAMVRSAAGVLSSVVARC